MLLLSNIFSWIYLPQKRKKPTCLYLEKNSFISSFTISPYFLPALGSSLSSNVSSFLSSFLPVIQYPDIHLITHIHILLDRFCTCGDYMPLLNIIHSKPVHFPEIFVIPFFLELNFYYQSIQLVGS